ncbi:L-arabinose transport system permease protein AraQ [Variibacter gotjawalensis]|uniref:L-arabinose transport system permease protein AraQ n=1 Tax=Variibacter gotjawalensis TaxID=1333996 RepID=A0A0S3PTF9_9BRAD|nr:carbohydrate ABC transporter permease [Variibacter gotjawalensis]NIK49419.1 multiple sugar transport system permease protein [Variibacter gotjawalensis]RZS51271.1 carbohydrate ABC transporter membrane protein 2 (CUT1 family) [Variibacter gotjawalensis]BAT59104.1 L-arabinose transport system permease protein AraQ [Variibacter gotjawalensis]
MKHGPFALSALRHMLLGIGAVLMLAPFALMISISLKAPGDVFSPTFSLLPSTWNAVENYTAAFTRQPLARYLFNGIFVGICIFAAQALIAVPCAYAFAKLRWRGRETTFALVLLGLLIPPQVTAIPLYILLWKLGLLDTYGAIILPSTISVFGIFLMRQFFRAVPDDLLHAARLDGLSEFAIVWRIMLPTAIPALVSFGILSFVWNWNEFFWPLIVVQSQHLATPPLGVVFFANAESGTNYNLLMAAAVVVNAPLVIAFLFAQRWFIDGVTMTSVK